MNHAAQIRIDLDASTPVNRQIVDQVRLLLVEGALRPGMDLPSVRRLATDLGVHFATVADAYRTLADEGWLEISHGRSARVLPRRTPSAGPEAGEGFRRRLRQLVAEARAHGYAGRDAGPRTGFTGERNTRMIPTWMAAVPVAVFPLAMHWLPNWRRNGLWFSVTVAADYPRSEFARATLRGFRMTIWLLALAALALVLLAPATARGWTLPLAMGIEVAGLLMALEHARRRTLPHAVRPEAVRSVGLIESPERMPFGAAAPLVPLAMLGGAAVYVVFSDTWRTAQTALWGGMLETAVMLLMGYGILRKSPRARVAANAEATVRFRRVLVEYMVVAAWAMAAILAAVAVYRKLPPLVLQVVFPALAIPYVWRLIRLGRGGGAGGDGTPDECWKLGVFYFNPEDPAIFVEKRFGIGYTCNLANRGAWMFAGLVLALSLSPLLLRYL